MPQQQLPTLTQPVDIEVKFIIGGLFGTSGLNAAFTGEINLLTGERSYNVTVGFGTVTAGFDGLPGAPPNWQTVGIGAEYFAGLGGGVEVTNADVTIKVGAGFEGVAQQFIGVKTNFFQQAPAIVNNIPANFIQDAVHNAMESGLTGVPGEQRAGHLNAMSSFDPDNPFGYECFPGGTPILMADGSTRVICEIRPGDRVLAYAAEHHGRGSLVPAKVTRLFRNVTDKWLRLRIAGRAQILTVTPGHIFLSSDGRFRRIDEIVATGGQLVLADGSIAKVTSEVVQYAPETSHLYEEDQLAEYRSIGATILAPEISIGWKTYNFEVESLHTYVAGGVRVHNDSTFTVAAAADQFSSIFARPFDGSQDDIGAMMGAIVDGRITAYGDYVGALSDDRYTAAFYDAIQNKIALSVDAFGMAASIANNGSVDRIVQYNNDGQFAGESRNLDHSSGWFATHDLSSVDLQRFDAADVSNLAVDIERVAFRGTTVEGGSPPVFSYEPEFAAGYDFNAGSFGVGAEGMTFTGGGDFGGGFGGGGGFGDTGFGDGGFGGGDFGDTFSPLIFDLNGDGDVDIRPKMDSTAYFDVDGDAFRERTAWVGPGDGLLVIDLGPGNALGFSDGVINQAKEVALADWTLDPNDTDVQAVSTVFDTNHNGRLDPGDINWGSFRLWVDGNQDGVSDPGELHTLDALGISGITLTTDHTVALLPDASRIHGLGTYSFANGATGTFADATLAFDAIGFVRVNQILGPAYFSEDGTFRKIFDTSVNLENYDHTTFDLAAGGMTQFDGIFAGPVNNWIYTSLNKAYTIYGGDGNDSLWTAGGNDIIDGGPGVDDLRAGAGDDTIYFDANDYIVDGGAGYDTGILTSVTPVNFDMGSHSLEALISNQGSDTITGNPNSAVYVDGRGGDDTITGGSFGDMLLGGAGNDTIYGEGGNDIVSGGAGTDNLSGGDGGDLLTGGIGNDTLYGDSGNDVLLGETGNDTLAGGDGDDRLDGGPGFNTLDGGGGTDTAVFHGAAANYTRASLNGQIVVSALDGSEHHTLSSIEFLAFADQVIAAAYVPVLDPVRWSRTVDIGPHSAGWAPGRTISMATARPTLCGRTTTDCRLSG